MTEKKKLIEVALPLEAINKESAREKSIRHGHPSTLHLWWARRPLAAARAVIFSSLVDDPSSHPEEFPTEEAQAAERQRLFSLIEELVKWENSNNQEVLDRAKAEIWKSTDGNPPPLLDPFAGGGAIPLEAQRLGLEAHASDLNPVAVMINKAMIEIPPKFAGQPPINPDDRMSRMESEWKGAEGLAADVRYYGEWMKQEAFKRIGHLYPKVKVPKEQGGGEATVIAWIWARTVKCPNPACGCEMPLASSFELSKKKGKEAYIEPVIEGKTIRYEVKYGKEAPEPPKTGRGQFKCICCGQVARGEYIRTEFAAKRSDVQLMAIAAEGSNGRIYIKPDTEQINASVCPLPAWKPEADMNTKSTDLVSGRGYGYTQWYELFTNRQLYTLSNLLETVKEVQKQILKVGGAEDYASAVAVYLSFALNKLVDRCSSFCTWDNSVKMEALRNTFGRQAIAMTWDFAEGNPFSKSSGCLSNCVEWVAKCVYQLPSDIVGRATQHEGQVDNGLRDIMVSTDPPYYDNIAYADLSDFFYVWLRQSLQIAYPELFRTMLVPKSEELTAMPYRFDGSKAKANVFFEEGMLQAFRQINVYVRADIPTTVYYAYKQSESDDENNTASTGWETMLSAIMQAGFVITGTWPMRTELSNRMIGMGTNALASSIVLVCRKRPTDAPTTTRRDFINALKRELKPALDKLQESNIAPVDLAQSAIGPGMGVYSRYSKVLEADGSPMGVRSALQIINQELDAYFNAQDGELDRDSRFCVDLYSQYAFNSMKFGDADVLARAKNTSVDALATKGVLSAQKGVVRLLTREEIPEKVDSSERVIWLLTQQLTRSMETGGITATARIVANMHGVNVEHAKALAYRLFQIAERKGWAQEAFAYNSLVIAWPEILIQAASLREIKPEQMTFDL